MVPDSIERDTFIAAPIERVWRLVTEAEHVGRWFGDAGAEIDLRPGGRMSLSWHEHGTVLGRVDVVDAPHRLACHWAAATDGTEPGPGNSTRVEFTLAREGEGTRLRVVESGFASLDCPESERLTKLAGNTEGWELELGELVEYAAREGALR